MRHLQLTIANIALGPRPLPLRHGTIQIVERDHGIDWEIQLFTIEEEPVAHGDHRLTINAIIGVAPGGQLETTQLLGHAILVRTADKVLVFRGDGSLDGFDLEPLGPE